MKNNQEIKVLYEDDDILAVDKPSGVLTIPDRYDRNSFNVRSYLSKKYTQVFMVHRLDRDTSGVLLTAKNAEAHRLLNIQFTEHTVVKIYHTFTSGVLPEESFEIDIPIMPNPSKPGTMMPSARGKESRTLVRILEKYRLSTLAECKLLTGRQHQLRVHLASVGFPLLVDPIYGNNDKFFVSYLKKRYNLKKGTSEVPIITRLTLHSYSISFAHPKSGEQATIISEYPKDFKALQQVLRKYSSI